MRREVVIIFIQNLKDLIGEIVSIKIVSIKCFYLSFAKTGYSWHVKFENKQPPLVRERQWPATAATVSVGTGRRVSDLARSQQISDEGVSPSLRV